MIRQCHKNVNELFYLNCKISFESNMVFTTVQNLKITTNNKATAMLHIFALDAVEQNIVILQHIYVQCAIVKIKFFN